MPKNAVQLLQEIVDKVTGELTVLRVLQDTSSQSADTLTASLASFAVTNDTLDQQLQRLLPARSSNPFSVAAIAATAAQPDILILQASFFRKGATIYNDSAAILYLLLGERGASSSAYTVQVPPNSYYEVPFTYAGAVRGVWASATGSARVTEYML